MARLPSFNEALAIATGATAAATPRGRRLALRAGRGGVRLTAAIARRHPAIATAVVLAELGYIFEDDIREVAQDLRERMPSPASGQGGSPTFSGESVVPKVKRKVSKANKAMKQAMKATKNNFKQATKIASKANPNTKSKIGKGTSTVKKLARKIRKSVWGVTKRFKK
jgi:hypothetical protein